MKRKTMSTLMACIVLSGTVDATTVKFGKALKEQKVTFEVVPGGAFLWNMGIEIKSIDNQPIDIELEVGRIFDAFEPGIQPYVVTRPAIIALDPQESKTIYLHARCGNSSAGIPTKSHHFNRTRMGPDEMITTLKEMNQFRITETSFYQKVVWHYTNGHSISTLSYLDTDPMIQKAIVDGICRRDQKAKADYSKTYKPAASGSDMEFSGEVDKIHANMQVVLEEPADLRVALLDKNGQTVKVIGYFMQQPTGKFFLPIELIPESHLKGDYTISLTDQNNKTLEQVPIQI